MKFKLLLAMLFKHDGTLDDVGATGGRPFNSRFGPSGNSIQSLIKFGIKSCAFIVDVNNI